MAEEMNYYRAVHRHRYGEDRMFFKSKPGQGKVEEEDVIKLFNLDFDKHGSDLDGYPESIDFGGIYIRELEK